MNVSLQTLSSGLGTTGLATTAVTGAASPSGGFADAIGAAIGNVESAQSQAESAASQLLINGTGDVHTVALADQAAGLSLELFQQVRNKFVSAYQEIMKMPM
jgi:flagellar hook-basal body complex protein FliE